MKVHDLIWPALLIVIALAPTQASVLLKDARVTPADALVAIVFITWVATTKPKNWLNALRSLPVALWVFLVLLTVSAIAAICFAPHGNVIRATIKEFLQFAGYFFVAYVVFAENLRDEKRLRKER